MTLTLNTASGVLHRSPRCAGRDTRFHVTVLEPTAEEIIGYQWLVGAVRVDHRCRKCLR